MNPGFRHALVFSGLILLLWLTPKVVFFVRADWHTRRSMWQAWLIRHRWARLSRMQGLAVTQEKPGQLRLRAVRRDPLIEPYVRDEDVARICQASASLRRDPATLLPETPRLAVVSSRVERSAASERGEDKSAEAVGHVSVRNDKGVA